MKHLRHILVGAVVLGALVRGLAGVVVTEGVRTVVTDGTVGTVVSVDIGVVLTVKS